MKAVLVRCDGLVLPPLNDMEVLTHSLDVAMEMPNPLVEGKFVSTSQVERA
jgi:hypothetical protein